MRIQTILITMLISINITACSSMGNVVPKTGPSMEQVYDWMNQPSFSLPNNIEFYNADQTQKLTNANQENIFPKNLSADSFNQDFNKVPNPELSLYIYPHFAGNEELPIPGYWTTFNAYEKDHYALRSE